MDYSGKSAALLVQMGNKFCFITAAGVLRFQMKTDEIKRNTHVSRHYVDGYTLLH